MTAKTDREWAEIAEQTLAEIAATPDEEIAARMLPTADLRAVADAADAVAAAEARLREAVQVARAHGWSWNRIAIPLGTSRQAARQRFGEPAAGAADVLELGHERAVSSESVRRALSSDILLRRFEEISAEMGEVRPAKRAAAATKVTAAKKVKWAASAKRAAPKKAAPAKRAVKKTDREGKRS